jgi:hypothetical protein
VGLGTGAKRGGVGRCEGGCVGANRDAWEEYGMRRGKEAAMRSQAVLSYRKGCDVKECSAE